MKLLDFMITITHKLPMGLPHEVQFVEGLEVRIFVIGDSSILWKPQEFLQALRLLIKTLQFQTLS